MPAAEKPTVALSTSWCSSRHTDGYAMLREVAEHGFEYVELGHGTRVSLVPGVLRAVREGVVRVRSTHNFCPLPPGVNQAAPNLFEPSSLNPREQEQWVRQTKRSIDFAAQVGASVLVCHAGRVRFFWFNPGRRLRELPGDASAAESVRQRETVMAVLQKLRRQAPRFLEQTRKSLTAVTEYARARGVRLGLENREEFEALPLDDTVGDLFDGVPLADEVLGYWHDTGHAQLKERLGLLEHRLHLASNAGRLIGFHLHDVSEEGYDHTAIGTGTVDFAMVKSFFKPAHLLTLEFSSRVSAEAVVDSRRRVEAMLG